jgi:nucleotide-binding universal stress UspA family protein
MFTHIMVTLDGGRQSELILPYAVTLATRMHTLVTLIRVVNTVDTIRVSNGERGSAGGRLGSREAQQRQAEKDATLYLERQAQNLRAMSVDPAIIVRSGDPSSEIVAAAASCGADTICMTTRSRRGLDRLMLGSVAERVLHTSKVPVVLLRA